jgi:hypothetical protein
MNSCFVALVDDARSASRSSETKQYFAPDVAAGQLFSSIEMDMAMQPFDAPHIKPSSA